MMPTLLDNLRNYNSQYKERACSIIDDALIVAGQMAVLDRNNNTLENSLLQAKGDLQRSSQTLLIGGMVNNGKSTIACAILGPSNDPALQHKYPLPIGSTEATPVLTEIVYSLKPYAKLIMDNGVEKELSFDDFIRHRVVQDTEENDLNFNCVKLLRIGWPNELLRQGIILKDSCGVGTDASRSIESFNALESADASLVIFKAKFPDAGLPFYHAASKELKAFCIINLTRDYPEDELVKILRKILYELVPGHPAVNALDLTAEDLKQILEKHQAYCINAKKALVAKYKGDNIQLQESNLPKIEQKLFELFTHQDSRKKHFENYINKARQVLDDLTGINKIEIESYQNDIANRKEEIIQLHADKSNFLDCRQKASVIIAQFDKTCQDQMQESFQQLLKDIKNLVIQHVTAKKPSLSELAFGSLKKEIEKMTSDLLESKLNTWETTTAALILNNTREQLLAELTALEKKPGGTIEVGLYVPGQHRGIQLEEQIGGWERVFSAAGGFLTGGILSGAAGAAYGAGGATLSSIGAIAGSVLAVTLGLTSLPAIIAIIILGELVGFGLSADDMQENFSRTTSEKLSEKMEALITEGKNVIKKGIAQNFATLAKESQAAYDAEIAILDHAIGEKTTIAANNELFKTEAIGERRYRIERLHKNSAGLAVLLEHHNTTGSMAPATESISFA